MREIKFRFWNKEYKTYESRYLLNSEGKIFNYWENKCYLIENQDNLIVEQFTEFKDKNENDIYEGDIICGTTHFKYITFFRVLYLKNKESSWYGHGFYLQASKNNPMIIPLCEVHNIQIISNINVNPEFLENK